MRVIGGTHRNRQLVAPKGRRTRPSASRLRESLFNICQSVVKGAHFLDLFAGSGAMGIEALSRGAAKATFIDSSKESLFAIRSNLKKLALIDCAELFEGDVIELLSRLERLGRTFSLIVADPPYGELELIPQLLHILDKSSLLEGGGQLFLECEKGEEVALEGFRSFEKVSCRSIGPAQLLQLRKL